VAAPVLGLPRWPHSSQLTRHLRAFGAQHVAALRAAVEDLTASHSAARRRLRRGEGVVVDLDQTAISANGKTSEHAARGHLKKKGERGYQATAVFAGDTGGGEDEVLAVFLDPGNAHAGWRFADGLAALERVLGPLARLPGLVLRFDCQYAGADALAELLRRGATGSGGSTRCSRRAPACAARPGGARCPRAGSPPRGGGSGRAPPAARGAAPPGVRSATTRRAASRAGSALAPRSARFVLAGAAGAPASPGRTAVRGSPPRGGPPGPPPHGGGTR
jgi:hypothetical protein